MLNFNVVSAGRDMVNDTDTSTTCRSKSRAPPLHGKMQKMKVLSKTWVSPKNRLNFSDQKLKTFTFGIREQNTGTTKPQRQQLKMDIVTRKKQTNFFDRGLQVKTVKTSARLQLVKL